MAKRNNRFRSHERDLVEITIEGMSHEGRGIAHVKGKVAFVEGALPGEVVTAAYQTNRGQFSELKAVEVIEPSPDRVEPPCMYASSCGGCSLQHLSSESQLLFKESVFKYRS